MASIQDFDCSSERVQKMANTLDVDIAQAVLTEKLRNFPYHDIVFRCSKCDEKSACDAWLEDNGNGAAVAPDYCRNKFLLEGLQE